MQKGWSAFPSSVNSDFEGVARHSVLSLGEATNTLVTAGPQTRHRHTHQHHHSQQQLRHHHVTSRHGPLFFPSLQILSFSSPPVSFVFIFSSSLLSISSSYLLSPPPFSLSLLRVSFLLLQFTHKKIVFILEVIAEYPSKLLQETD